VRLGELSQTKRIKSDNSNYQRLGRIKSDYCNYERVGEIESDWSTQVMGNKETI
jgi:hypothetical protein